MKKAYVVIICFCLALTIGAQSSKLDSAYASKDHVMSVELAKTCYESDSTNIGCLKLLAASNNKLGDQAAAKKYYHLLEFKDSSNVDIYVQLASIYEQQQQLPKAIKYYTTVNKMLPENPLYFRKNANLYKGYGEKLEAFRLYAKANKLNPRDVLTLKGLVELSMENGQFEMVDSLLDVGLAMDSMNISLNYLMARSKYKQKQYDSVVLVFHKLQGHIDLTSYYNKMLGYAYLQIDSVDLAISKLQLALVDEDDSEKLHYYLATAYEKKGNMEGALDHYEKAVKSAISPDLDLYHRSVGRLANKEKDYKKAINAYRDAYKYGDDPVVLYYLAAASDHYYKDKSIAISYYQKYIKSNHSHQEYKDYAKKRVRYLKEIEHQSKS